MSELMDNHIGIMNWAACKKCGFFHIPTNKCSFLISPNPNLVRHLHIDENEVVCKDYEEIL